MEVFVESQRSRTHWVRCNTGKSDVLFIKKGKNNNLCKHIEFHSFAADLLL